MARHLDATFNDVLQREAWAAATLLKQLVAAANSAGYSSSALRHALYEDALVRLLDRIHGEHKCVDTAGW